MNIYYYGKENCRPGHFFGPAIRTHYLIHFVLKGQGIYKTPENVFKLNAGDAFLIRPGEVTYYEADQKNPWSYAWVAFDGSDSINILMEHNFIDNHLITKIINNKMERIITLLMEITTIFEKTAYDENELLGYFYLIISCIEKSNRINVSDYDKKYLEKAIIYIHNNYSYKINISDVARHVGINRTYLYRIFIQYENESPKQYLMNHRLLTAKSMLEHTNYNITEIALSSGFHDTSSFCKYFQRIETMTPLQYRKKVVSKYGCDVFLHVDNCHT